MVEAVLGTTNGAPTVADTEQARSLLARMIAEGAAVPLNLLGTTGEVPDFIVSTAVFQHVFTLRGDKAWKQPPSTSGTLKVSPLSLATYTLLAERVTMSAYDLATQLGKEVTEVAVLRSLNELWSRLRVLPVPQNDGSPTLWELTSARFTKQIKAGANAGQPTALSALTTLYLGQALVATEDEIEVFLSPVAARSRIRDVVHALMAARELDTFVIDGKTLLHVSGDAPQALPGVAAEEGSTELIAVGDEKEPASEEGGRIRKFVPKPRKTGTGFVAKPGRSFDRKDAVRTPRERRPFERGAAGGFAKPWEEEKAARLAGAGRPSRVPEQEGGEGAREGIAAAGEQQERRPYAPKKAGFDRGEKRPFGAKSGVGGRPAFGDRPRSSSDRPRSKPSFGGDRAGGSAGSTGRPSFRREGEGRPPRRDFGDARPPRREFGEGRPPRREDGEARPPRREFTPRGAGAGGFEGRPPRKTFSKGEGFGPRREGFGGKPSFGGAEARPPRREFDGARPARPFGGKPGFSRDRDASGAGTSRPGRASGPPFRKFDAPRGARPFSSDRPVRPFQDRGERPARPTEGADRPSRSFEGKKPFGKGFSKPGGFSGRSEGGSKPYGKPGGGAKGKTFAGKAGNPFEKFVGNKRPFGKRAPARKFKPEKSESAE